MSSSKASSSSPEPILVTGLWDHENAKLPPGYNIGTLRSSINLALKHYNPRCELDKLVAFGPQAPPRARAAGIEFHKLRRENVRCQGNPKSSDCYKFVVKDDGNPQEKRERNTDAADVQILIDLVARILTESEHILLIAGDGDFVYFIERFQYGTNIKFMVAITDKSDKRLPALTQATWRWSSQTPSIPTMIHGGPPTQ